MLSLPFDLRRVAAFDARALTAFVRIFVRAIFARSRTRALRAGLANAQCGAVTFIQRFGSSLNLNVHFHVVATDGVFVRDKHGRVEFHADDAPTRGDLETLLRQVQRSTARWLARRGRASRDDGERNDDGSALGACAEIATRRTRFESTRVSALMSADEPRRPPERDAVALGGFNLHASVAIAAEDDLGRERLFRYGARPAFSTERMNWHPDGRHIAYRVKKLRSGAAKVCVFTPLELLARLAALVPPPALSPHSLSRRLRPERSLAT